MFNFNTEWGSEKVDSFRCTCWNILFSFLKVLTQFLFLYRTIDALSGPRWRSDVSLREHVWLLFIFHVDNHFIPKIFSIFFQLQVNKKPQQWPWTLQLLLFPWAVTLSLFFSKQSIRLSRQIIGAAFFSRQKINPQPRELPNFSLTAVEVYFSSRLKNEKFGRAIHSRVNSVKREEWNLVRSLKNIRDTYLLHLFAWDVGKNSCYS